MTAITGKSGPKVHGTGQATPLASMFGRTSGLKVRGGASMLSFRSMASAATTTVLSAGGLTASTVINGFHAN